MSRFPGSLLFQMTDSRRKCSMSERFEGRSVISKERPFYFAYGIHVKVEINGFSVRP